MIVVGGSHLEICLVPFWKRVFGSGGRAAVALSSQSKEVHLHTYAGKRYIDDVKQTMQAFGIKPSVRPIDDNISFSYFHPLSPARLSPERPRLNKSLKVSGKNILRFGFVEGDAIVKAEYAVYDPQGGPHLEKFEKNSSTALHLAYVLNENEILALTKKARVNDAVSTLLRRPTDVVVVKRGPDGASVYRRGADPKAVPSYWSEKVFKIGSGDIFSAIFAHEWAENRKNPVQAADIASRAVSQYVELRSLPVPTEAETNERKPLKLNKKAGRIYLGGPFFDIAKRWLVEELLRTLENMGASVFSPFHDVGSGPAKAVAKKDLDGLRDCSAVLALIDGSDPGTLFEIGYARSKRIPVVALAENVNETDKTMLIGTDCEVVDDFATAIYRVLWASRRK